MRLTTTLVLVGLLGVAHPGGAATSSAILLKCQKTLHSKVRSFVNVATTALLGCAQKVEDCVLAQEIDGADPTVCLAAAATACSASTAKIGTLRSVGAAKANLACGLVPIGDANAFLGGLGFFTVAAGCGAGTTSDLVTCVFTDAQCAAEHTVFTLDPRAGAALATGGIGGAHPCVAP